MTPRECFGLIVRVLGLPIFLSGLFYWLSVFSVLIGPSFAHRAPLSAYLIYAAALTALGLYFLRGAPALVRFSYPESLSPEPPVKGDGPYYV